MSLAKIPLAGVIGSPIAHSKSPQIHGHWLKTLGLKGAYIPLHVEPEDLRQVLEAMPKMGFNNRFKRVLDSGLEEGPSYGLVGAGLDAGDGDGGAATRGDSPVASLMTGQTMMWWP